MAHSLSAKKRVRQNVRKRTLNRSRKSQVKTQIKHLETTIDEGKVDGGPGAVPAADARSWTRWRPRARCTRRPRPGRNPAWPRSSTP